MFAACLFLLLPDASGKTPTQLEFRGEVSLPPKTVPRGRRIVLNLLAVGTQASVRTWADPRGRFRFKKVKPGSYALSILIPGTGEILETVDITPSFADSRGRVEKKFDYDQEALQNEARVAQQGLVSVRELSIPYRARREYQRARDRLRKEETDSAVEHLQKAIEQAPQYMEALNTLGIVYFQRKKYAEAEKYFRTALEKAPDSFEPLLNLGGALLAQGRAEEALEINQRVQEARPNDALANAQLGFSYLLSGDEGQAIVYLEWVEDIDPAHFTNPQLSLARIYMRRDETEDAVEELREFLKFHPDSGDATEARTLLQQAESILQETAAGRSRFR